MVQQTCPSSEVGWVTDDYISLHNHLIGPNSSVMHIPKMVDFGNKVHDNII